VRPNGAARLDEHTLASDEVIVRWSGWSLAVSRPRFAPAGAPPAPKIDRPFRFVFALDPDAPLPQLRFTADYDVRLRVADIAGGGLAVDDLDADRCAIRDRQFRRHEPVPSPAVLVPGGAGAPPLGPGETPVVVVIRDGGADLSRATRDLVRPQASFAMAEQHGEFDHPSLDHEVTFGFLQREALADPAAGGVQALAVPAPGSPRADADDSAWPSWPALGTKSLVLAPRSGDQPVLRWEGDRLVVRLAPAEVLDLELSCKLTENFRDHFHIGSHLPDDDGTKRAADAGRHPLISPAQRVALVHAVRQPLRVPDAGSGLTARTREPRQTSVALAPGAVFGVDGNSTARLDVALAWTDRTDTGPAPGTATATFAVARGQRAVEADAVFDFGDTRHRVVTPTLRGVGRFRTFYDPAEADEAFCVASQPLTAVDVPSTARPAPPVVLGVRPAFRWFEEPDGVLGPGIVRRTREGARLRVELARPWYLTGDGERLAVVLWDTAGGPPPAELRDQITQAGRDPTWETGDTDRWPTPSQVLGGQGEPGRPALADRTERVLAVPFQPFLDGDRWWADVHLRALAAASYAPFVRLAVARYQPSSLPGLELSRVVPAPMAPLLPDRALTVARDGATVTVTLDGLGPVRPQPNRVDTVLETTGAPGDAELSAFAASGGVPAWVPVGGAVAHGGLGDELRLTVPAGTGRLRVRVREVELVGADAGVAPPPPATDAEMRERAVFVDAVAVPA
jgi:hypothetical protein